jgi:hypothetical protein
VLFNDGQTYLSESSLLTGAIERAFQSRMR